MDIVNHSKCKRCSKVRNVSELKDSSDGVGFVCKDQEACKKTTNQKQEEYKS